jgi:hypothetical protein
MQRNVSPLRWLLTILLLAGLFFSAAGQSLAREERSPDYQSCLEPIATWNFNNGTTVPSNGHGKIIAGNGIIGPSFVDRVSPSDKAVSYSHWDTRVNPDDYIEFIVDTTRRKNIQFQFDSYSSKEGPLGYVLRYSVDGKNFINTNPVRLQQRWDTQYVNLGTIKELENKPKVLIRLYAYKASSIAADWILDDVMISGCPANFNTKTPTPTGWITPTPLSFKSVVITEVAWMGTTYSSTHEWIELYNTTNQEISLDGWHLISYRYTGSTFVKNLDISFTTDDKISPRISDDPKDTSGFFLLEHGFSLTDDDAISDIKADKIWTNVSLYDSGEILLLCSKENIDQGKCNIDAKNQIIDYVNGSLTKTGGIKPWPAGSSTTKGSMERKNLISDDPTNYFTHTGDNPRYGHDGNGNAIKGTPKHPNWAYNVTATPFATYTPTRTPTRRPAAAPILVINEVLARSGTDWNNDGKVDVYDEFIEVINSGTVNVNLSSYKLDDRELDANGKLLWNGFTLPSITLKPGEMTVFYGSQTGIHLEDSGDTVYLMRTSNSAVVDQVTYPISKSLDFSLCRYKDGYGSWIVGCFPTPGRPNALTGDRTPSSPDGFTASACLMPDSVPDEFVLAECTASGLGIWNRSYWDSFPGEGNTIWQSESQDKWLIIYQ